ncbi:MAG TPA: type 4a pilus biogenesis protein PilO [Acidimicrobiales bacterium]|nr:type 4a pilus biogenesis protein PilO [Acidimicrobiales bacterium]
MNKRVIAIAVAASVVIVGIWYFGVNSHQSKSIKQANAAAAAADAQASSLRSQIAVLQREKTQLPSTQAKLAALKLALPDTPALDKLVDDINAAAAQAGVDWQTVSPTKPATFAGTGQSLSSTNVGGAQSVTVALQVNGSVHQILDFVTRLNTLSRLLDVTSINLASGAAKPTAQLTTQIFFVPSSTGPATTPAAATP